MAREAGAGFVVFGSVRSEARRCYELGDYCPVVLRGGNQEPLFTNFRRETLSDAMVGSKGLSSSYSPRLRTVYHLLMKSTYTQSFSFCFSNLGRLAVTR